MNTRIGRRGPQFVVGHILLTGLFFTLAVTYWAVLVLGLMRVE